MKKNKRICFQWGVYLVELNSDKENIQNGKRPCICISNDKNNTWSNVVQFIPLTSQIKNNLPIHYTLSSEEYKFLKFDSVVLIEQLTTQSIDDVIQFLGRINNKDITNIKECIKAQFDL